MKRSSHIALALMGAASFGASFFAGNALLDWMNRAKAAPHQAAQQANCTTRADGAQTCPAQRSSGTRVVYYYAPVPASDDRTASKPSASKPGSPSASLSNEGARASPAKAESVARSGFGSVGKSLAGASGAVGG